MWHLENGIYSIGNKIPIGGIAVLLAILVVSSFFIKYFNVKYKNINCLLNFATLSVILFSFSNIIVEIYRISLYLSIFNILLLSNALNKYKFVDEKRYKILTIIIEVIFIAYFLFRNSYNVGINPYVFL